MKNKFGFDPVGAKHGIGHFNPGKGIDVKPEEKKRTLNENGRRGEGSMSNVKCRVCGKVSGPDEVKLLPQDGGGYQETCPDCGGEVDFEWYANTMNARPRKNILHDIAKELSVILQVGVTIEDVEAALKNNTIFPTFELHGTQTGRFDCSKENISSAPRGAGDNWDVFEDRVRSLLTRWGTFHNKKINQDGISTDCIKGFLLEVSDEYTHNLMEE